MAIYGDSTAPDPKSKDKTDILKTAIKQYELCVQSEQHNIDEAYDDLKFLAGEQWLDTIVKERVGEGRIMLTINRLPQFIRQITGDMRLNKPSIKVRPAGGEATEEIAEIQSGLIRNIEAMSMGPLVYVLAGQDAARAGWGAFRITTEYADTDMFEQDIRLRHIPNSLGVLFDPNSRMLTREDARYCFVPTRMTYDRFKEDYPDAKVSSWDEARSLALSDIWCDAREIVVCEYWTKEAENRTLVRMGDGSIFLAESPPKKFDGLDPQLLIDAAVKTRKVQVDCVYQRIMTGAEILDGPNKHPGKFIPIIPVLGEEISVGDRVIRHGAIRWAKDPQRMYNYHQTTATETHALAPKAPFIGTAEQFKGFEKEWRQANKRNLPYLRYNPDDKAPPPSRSSVATDISSSMVLAQQAANDLHETIGIYPPSLGQKSNEVSGVAIRARQHEADVGTYVYIDNLATAIQYAGRQFIDLIPKIYDTERIVRILHEDDETDQVTLNQFNKQLNKVENDVTVGKYDVVVEVGPAFSTRRAEAADAMANFIQLNPQSAPLVMDLIADAMDWPNKDKFKERFKAALPPGIDPEVDAERAQRAGPPKPPPPEVQIGMASEMSKIAQNKAGAEKTQAETVAQQLENLAAVGAVRAEAAAKVAETEGKRLDNAGAHLDNLHKASDLGHKHGQMQAGTYGEELAADE